MKKKIYITAGFIFCTIVTVLVIYSLYNTMPTNPLDGSDQLIIVVAKSDTSHQAVLQAFTRSESGWRFAFAFPVVIGKNGIAWGRGLHNQKIIESGEPVKREGDGKSPAGVFELLQAYGYLPPMSVRIRFPYMQINEDMVCIDEVKSEYYNMIVRSGEKGLDPASLPSHEDMLRTDNLYKYIVTIGHNTKPVKEGMGSCIFLHVWKDSESYTAGCTAMDEESMLRLLSWLDSTKTPRLVQLTRSQYVQFKTEWGLPDITP